VSTDEKAAGAEEASFEHKHATACIQSVLFLQYNTFRLVQTHWNEENTVIVTIGVFDLLSSLNLFSCAPRDSNLPFSL
jgi:hypothetical protein